MSLQIQANGLASFSLDGAPVPGFWDTKSGGDLTADVQKHRPGGQTRAFPMPGAMVDADDIVLTRVVDLARDPIWIVRFRARIHRGVIVGSYQPTDGDKIPVGDPYPFQGILAGFQEPEFDNNSGDKQFMGVTISIETP